jgi:phage shock protein PspC (stress-responsive transcriptional regulator)
MWRRPIGALPAPAGVDSAKPRKNRDLLVLARLVLSSLHPGGPIGPFANRSISMQTAAQPNLFTREDTFFGVCAGLGEDFGFSPTYLRVAFAALLFFNPAAALGTYAVAGMVVLASRWMSPNPRPAFAAQPAAAQPVPVADNESIADALAVAA